MGSSLTPNLSYEDFVQDEMRRLGVTREEALAAIAAGNREAMARAEAMRTPDEH